MDTTASKLDIVNLIEKNPITRLSKDYQSNLINKIKEKFTETQQQLFVSSFFCYLNYNSKTDFIIDLNDVWKWVGFTRKDHAKRLINKLFVIDIDYKILLPLLGEHSKQGGINKETILMNINTFKKFCLKADTKKADEIHEYYINLEELLHQTMDEESQELRTQLSIKDKQLKNKNKQLKNKELDNIINIKINRHNVLIEKSKGKRCLYICEIEENKLIKVGSTKEIYERYKQLKKQYGNCIFLEIFERDNFREIESDILSDFTIKKYLYREPINGHLPQEVVKLCNEFNYSQFLTIVKHYISQVHFFSPEQLLEQKYLDVEKQKLDLEKQKLDLEKQKLDTINIMINNNININSFDNILNNNILNIQSNLKQSTTLESQSNNLTNINLEESINLEKNEIQKLSNIIVEESRELEKNETQNPNYYTNFNFKIKGKSPMGQKIQKIDPNNLKNIITTYNSMVYLLRSPENNGFQKSCIQTAIKKNRIYKGFRWNFVKKDEDPNISKALPTTNFKYKIPIRSTILKINSTKTEIIDSFYTKEFLWKELKISKLKLRKITENNELYDNHYYIEYNKCSNELLEKYKKPVNRVIYSNSKTIKQINPISKEVIIFNTLNEIYIKYGFSTSTIINAINDKNVHGGFLWEYYHKEDIKKDNKEYTINKNTINKPIFEENIINKDNKKKIKLILKKKFKIDEKGNSNNSNNSNNINIS